MLKIVVLVLFFLSGFSGLLYEVVWTRVFGLIFGNTTLAISTVLAAFMSGLALGSVILGKFSDRMKNHLKIYAFLELGIGISALLVPLLKIPIEGLFAAVYPFLENNPLALNLFKFLVAFLIMLPATFLMGGTLPVLSHSLVRAREKLGMDLGRLYSINTFGAMMGTLVTGFFLIRLIGVFSSIPTAVFVNFIIAITAFILARSFPAGTVPEEKSPKTFLDRNSKIVTAVMAISGFVALSYEVLWSRVLVFVFTNSVYAFTVILTTFLFGIAFGAYAIGRFADRSRQPAALLGWIQAGIGVTVFFASLLLINLPDLHYRIFTLEPNTTWWHWNAIRFFEAFLVMFLPTFLMGASFPVAAKAVVTSLTKLGSGLGVLYFFNTIGGVLGSFLTGFVFISLFGASATMAGLIALSLAAGIFLILQERFEMKPKRVFAYLIPALVLLALAVQFTPKKLFTVAYSTTERDLELIDYREGVEGTVTVHLQKTPFEQKKRIDVDGLNVAGTSFMLRTLQTLQGHLPLIVHGNAEKVLQIGFGTGQTSYSALLHPIEQFTLVEISENVLELSALHFQEINKGVMENPRFRPVILDGKNYLKYTGEKYDVIMNDANYAVATGSASLFTRDHFEYCKSKLKPGGLLSTWMTTDLDPQDFKIVLKTFQFVFPYSVLWMAPNCINKQVVLMGAAEPLALDFEKMRELFADPRIRPEFAAININSAFDLLDCLLLDPEGIARIAAAVPINTDNHPILEFSTRDIRSRDFCAYQNLAAMLIYPPRLNSMVTGLPADSGERNNVEENLQRHFSASRKLLSGMMEFYQGKTGKALETLLNGSRLIPESDLAAYYYTNMDMITWELNREMVKNPENPEAQLKMARHQIGLRQYDAASKLLSRITHRGGDDPFVDYEIARCYLGKTELDSAEYYLRKSLEVNDRLSGAWYFLGQILSRQGKPGEALEAQQRAVVLDPRMYEAHNAAGAIYQAQQKYEEAAAAYRASLSVMEFQPEITGNLADCFLEMKEIPEAISMYQQALKMGNESPSLIFNLGNAYFFNKQYDLATDCYRQAIALDSANPEFYYNLGNTLVMQGNLPAAADVFVQAVQLNPQEPDYYNNLAMCYRSLGDLQTAMQVFNRGLKSAARSELLIQNAQATQKLLEAE